MASNILRCFATGGTPTAPKLTGTYGIISAAQPPERIFPTCQSRAQRKPPPVRRTRKLKQMIVRAIKKITQRPAIISELPVAAN
jgi:hypothetical protein